MSTIEDRARAMYELYAKKVAERREAMKEAYCLLYLEAYLKANPDQKVEELVLCEQCDDDGKYRWWLEPKSVNDQRRKMPWVS